MMSSELTLAPGPWTYRIGEDYTEFFDAQDESIFMTEGQMPEQVARLIAAAPELLKAAGALVDRVPNPNRDSYQLLAARNRLVRVLNKAHGKDPWRSRRGGSE